MPRTHKAVNITGVADNVQAFGPDERRKVVYISPPDAGSFSISFGQNPTVLTEFRIHSTADVLKLTEEEMGQLIHADIRVTTAGAGTIAITCVSES